MLPHFKSAVSYQRGRGFGGLLRGIFRAVTPLLRQPIVKKTLQKIGKAAAFATLDASQKALKEKDIKAFGPALRTAGKSRAKELLSEVMAGKGPVRKRRIKPISLKPSLNKRRRVRSRDIFQDLE